MVVVLYIYNVGLDALYVEGHDGDAVLSGILGAGLGPKKGDCLFLSVICSGWCAVCCSAIDRSSGWHSWVRSSSMMSASTGPCVSLICAGSLAIGLLDRSVGMLSSIGSLSWVRFGGLLVVGLGELVSQAPPRGALLWLCRGALVLG